MRFSHQLAQTGPVVLLVCLLAVSGCDFSGATIVSEATSRPATPASSSIVLSTATPPALATVPSTTPVATIVPPTRTPLLPPIPTVTATAIPRKSPPPVTGHLAQVLTKGDPSTGCVALTFDMGEKAAGATSQVLDSLKNSGAHATFLLTGQWAEANPLLVKRMVAEGHELGNHSYDHPDFTKIGEAARVSQLSRTEDIAKKIIGLGLKPYFRPPFGAYNDSVRGTLASQGYHLLYWTLDSADWRPEMEVGDIVERVSTRTKAGDIIVFHGYAEKTGKAIPLILPRLKANKFCFRILSEVLAGNATSF